MERRRVYLLRHGEVSYFGGADLRDPELTERGRDQARKTGEALAEISFDRMVSSGLKRTNETTAIVSRGADFEVIEDFQEIRTGNFEGIESADAMRSLVLGAFDKASDSEARFLTGEEFGDFEERIRTAWERLIEATDWNTLLLVAHGVVNRAILTHALRAPRSIYRFLEQDPCCVNIIDVDGSDATEAMTHVRLANFTPWNLVKLGLSETTLETLWREFSGEERSSRSSGPGSC